MSFQLKKVLLGSRITYIEPAIRVILAVLVLGLSLAFVLFSQLNALWLGLAIFLAIGLLGSGLTQFCLMGWSLQRLGFRSEWDELKALERAHAISQTRASYLDTLNRLNEVIVEMTVDGQLLWKSDKWSQMFENEARFQQCISTDDRHTFNEMVRRLLEGSEQLVKVHFHGVAHESAGRWIEGRFTMAQDDTHDVVIRGILRDITDLFEESRINAYKATHDDLTGLPNRALFGDRLEQAKARADRAKCGLAILFIDLDNFKQVNDQLGHKAGDQLLVAVATAMRTAVRPGDTVSRFGGDEFVALIVDLESSDIVRHIAEGLLDAARHKLSEDVTSIVTFSIGVAHYPSDAKNIDELMALADQALYVAKAAGRDNVKYAKDLVEHTTSTPALH